MDNLSGSAKLNNNVEAGKVLWLTGLSGAGKSTIAEGLGEVLLEEDTRVIILDGDNIRKGLCKDLGFSQEDRAENNRRVAEVCKLFSDTGVTVISSFISPTTECRDTAKAIIGDKFREIFISCPLEVCEARDVKGLYKKARAGEIPNFTGIDSVFEVPVEPYLIVHTDVQTLDECVDDIYDIII